MNKFILISALAVIGLLPPFHQSLAVEGQAVQKAFENTKQYLDDLVSAKDENKSDDLGLRVDAFRQVLDLSKAEAKDLEYKLLTIDKDKNFEVWKKGAMKNLTEAMVFFDSQKESLTDAKTVDLVGIKKIASDFKSWRDKEYLPITEQIQDFLLIKQEEKGIQTAKTRLDKITNDLKGLKQSQIANSAEIKKSLENSKKAINESIELNGRAANLFIEKYFPKKISSSTEPAATSTEPAATSTKFSASIPAALSVSTSTVFNSTSTATSSPEAIEVPIVSIKDLVRFSLEKIRESYRGFIDISNLVRKLLK